jgi:hypothetical protein
MAKLITITLFCLITCTVQAQSWILHTNESNLKVWHQKDSKAKITLTNKKSKKVLKPSVRQLKKLESQKSKMLTHAKIKNWQAGHYKSWQVGSNYFVTFDGSYTNLQGKKITYKEIHRYSGTNISQLLYTRSPASKEDVSIQKLIKGFL